MTEDNLDNERLKNNMRVNAFYTKKIHSNTEFYENEKRRVAEYQKNRYENDAEYREKKKEYCRIKMRELYQRKKALAQSITV
jgi:hypothetical protein